MTKELGTCSDIDALRRIVPPAGKTWLDIGCGDGTVACQLAGLGAVVTGIEPDQTQARKNRTRELPANVTLMHGQAQDLPLDDNTVDTVLFSYSLHHVPVPDMSRALGEACRVLNATGELCVVEPIASGAYHRAIELFHDETRVRAAAIEALGDHARPRFAKQRIYAYTTLNRYASFAEFCEYMLGLTYNNYDPRIVKSDAVRERFESALSDEGYVLEQPIRVNLFSGLL